MASPFVKPAIAPRTITPRIVQGFDGPVEIDAGAQTVTKTFLNAEAAVAILKAQREVEYASRFYAAVAGVSGIACPKILRSDFAPPPRVTLQFCPGDTLWVVVGATRPDDPKLDEIAGRIHDCLEVYVATFPRSRHDFKLENMLYDSDSGILTLIDFANDAEHEMSRNFPLDAAVGNWLGRVCYDLVRPSKLRMRNTSYQILMRKVLKTFEGQVVQARVRDFACTAFRMWGPCGTAPRRAYYRAMETIVVSRYLKRSGLNSQPNAVDVAG